ncbi:amidase signature enzyme [Coniochaeta ligniaria NRRL 30616]|uniref:Amidase signature enzyme n=1 Tax=Coniochaeta ligniaria NRRL 30616 TaxID=1408157 RepID=A0A1J7JCW6_9PEZI|nr:amidase signature enzyme [Coniochaeta ligniaria NRRL 30616]
MAGLNSVRRLSVRALLLLGLAASSTSATALPSNFFDAREATVEGIHNALFNGLTTCRAVVSAFIARIEEFNPVVNAIIALNPDALSIADDMDLQLAAGNVTAPLFCIPILLKDNYDAVGMNTTGGSLGLAGARPTADSPAAAAFKKAGAIILGKANLHEIALEGLSVSSLGGQTVNPYDHTRTPGGSSGGSGAAIGTSFAVFATGTDTVNSLRSPASANSLFSFRPTRGLITRTGVIPISYTQDTLGAMARNLKDLAAALTVMASIGYDPRDNHTALAPPEAWGKDYSAALYGGSLKGLRIGILEGFFNNTPSAETTPVINVMADVLSSLASAGVELVNITEPVYNAAAISAQLDVQTSEYRELLNAYLSNPELQGDHPRTFNELYTSGKFLVIPSQYAYVNAAFVSSTANASYIAKQRGITNLTTALRATFASNDLDAIIYPEQKNLVVKIGSPSQSGRNGILAALTGSPVLAVPAGFSPPSADAPVGVPIGLEILGRPFSEAKLLNIARHVSEALAPVRKMPAFANYSVETREYETVPVVKPNSGNINAAYPLGRLS